MKPHTGTIKRPKFFFSFIVSFMIMLVVFCVAATFYFMPDYFAYKNEVEEDRLYYVDNLFDYFCAYVEEEGKPEFELDSHSIKLFLLDHYRSTGQNLKLRIFRTVESNDEYFPPVVEDPEPVLDVLSKRGMETLLWGRINPAVASVMEAGVAGRLRTVSEERGMKTRGRSRGTVFGDLSDPAVLRGFAASFGRLCDAGIIDTRPVFSAFGCCGEDALFSDLGMHERIINPFVRSFSEIVRGTGRPVLFGGHSLVSGGLLVMAGILRERR